MKIATCFSVASRFGWALPLDDCCTALLLIGMTTVAFHGASLIQGGSLRIRQGGSGAASAAELHAPQFEESAPTQLAHQAHRAVTEMEHVWKRFVSKRYKVSAWRCDRFWPVLNRPGKARPRSAAPRGHDRRRIEV